MIGFVSLKNTCLLKIKPNLIYFELKILLQELFSTKFISICQNSVFKTVFLLGCQNVEESQKYFFVWKSKKTPKQYF